jgi:UV DNA damage endonuclease
MIRFGLCCLFIDEPIKFRTITAKTLSALPKKRRLERVSQVCLHNAESVLDALHTVERLGIGAFRILSPLFPRYTHPEMGYTPDVLPEAKGITAVLKRINTFRRSHDIRLSFHPDQFVVLNSPREDVVRKSIAEIEYQAVVAKSLGAEVINIHVGGAYGDKAESLKRFAHNFERLSGQARKRLALENEDSLFTPADILPLCRDLRIPLVDEATARAVETWPHRKQEPHFHISSPKYGWKAHTPKPQAGFVDPSDIPDAWREIGPVTLDGEAKAKEKAVLKLKAEWPLSCDEWQRRCGRHWFRL